MGGRIAGQIANQQPEHCSHAFIVAFGRDRPAENISADARFFPGESVWAAWYALRLIEPVTNFRCRCHVLLITANQPGAKSLTEIAALELDNPPSDCHTLPPQYIAQCT